MTLWVDELGEVEAIACDCGHGLLAVRIEGFEPVFRGRLGVWPWPFGRYSGPGTAPR